MPLQSTREAELATISSAQPHEAVPPSQRAGSAEEAAVLKGGMD